jgi:hypothetical protein
VTGSSQGTSYPESGPYLAHLADPRVADVRDRDHPDRGDGESGWCLQPSSRYRGSSRTRPRRAQARAPKAVPGHVCGHQCVAVSPALLRAMGGRGEACRRFCQVRLTFGDNPFGGIACWGGTQASVELHVPDVYRRGYLAARVWREWVSEDRADRRQRIRRPVSVHEYPPSASTAAPKSGRSSSAQSGASSGSCRVLVRSTRS